MTTPGESSSQAYGRTRTSGESDALEGKASAGTAEVIDHAKETISSVASQAGGKVTEQLDTQRDRAASNLGSVAQALRQTSDQIRDQNESGALPVHQYVASAADQLERVSGYLRNTDVRQMVGDVERFARRQPGLFLGGAFLLGVLGARFLKSSGQDAISRGGSVSTRGYSSGNDYTQDYSGAQSYGGAQDSGYSDRYTPGSSSQYGASGQRSSSQYVQGESPTYGQSQYQGSDTPAPQSSGGSRNATGIGEGEV